MFLDMWCVNSGSRERSESAIAMGIVIDAHKRLRAMFFDADQQGLALF